MVTGRIGFLMVQYDPLSFYDEEINRRDVPALKTHPMVVGQDGEVLFAIMPGKFNGE
jgi:hypothetical protein